MKNFDSDRAATLGCIAALCFMVLGFALETNLRPFNDITYISAEEKAFLTDAQASNLEKTIENEPKTQPLGDEEKSLYININTDDISELDKLSGIGEKMAQRIIDYRKKHGDFEVIEDIMRVSGIGKKRFEDIKENIYVE